MAKQDSRYQVTCLLDHTGFAPPGSELEKRAKAREDAGHYDALILSANECPECIQDLKRRNAGEEDAFDLDDAFHF